jgi:hypothetical protein
MAIKKDTLDQLLEGRDPKEVFNKDELFDELKKALADVRFAPPIPVIHAPQRRLRNRHRRAGAKARERV